MAKLSSIDLTKPIVFYGNRLCESDEPAFVELSQLMGNERLCLLSMPVTEELKTAAEMSATLMAFIQGGRWRQVFEENLQSLACTALGEPLLTGWMSLDCFGRFIREAQAAEPALQAFAVQCLQQLPAWKVVGVDEVCFDGFELLNEENGA
jgi:hypothetical protein